MVAANPERTSWTPEEVRGLLRPVWFKPIEPYISPKVQIIAAYNMLYVSTARGLYALDADTGAEEWVYPTDLPLGNSPTIADGVAYVGGLDHLLYAVDAFTGQGLWTFEGGKGFETNPLIVNNAVYVGNRDGYMYAIGAQGSATPGILLWRYKTGGPILFSAAYEDGALYFASNDSRAYGLDAQSGQLLWRSAKLPGGGFRSWWPVVYQNTVIFSGSLNYRPIGPGEGSFPEYEVPDIFPNRFSDPKGTLIGPRGTEPGSWSAGTPTINTSLPNTTVNGQTTPITEYFEAKPWRRTYFVLDRATGNEVTYDFDADGDPEYAPILWLGDRNGNRYPPVVGGDGVLYQTNVYRSDPWIPGGQVSGWKLGTPFISIVTSDWGAEDEPHAFAAGGNLIYWNLCCDREAGAFDVSVPNTSFPANDPVREWRYFDYNLVSRLPGYNQMAYVSGDPYNAAGSVYGGRNGVYGWHGDVNPPIPYKGKVYMHRSNAIIAFGTNPGTAAALPLARSPQAAAGTTNPPSPGQLKQELSAEIQQIIDAGHLRTSYVNMGFLNAANRFDCGHDLTDYWHTPAETILTLLRALPYLPAAQQESARAYLQTEFSTYPPFAYEHLGWSIGAAREVLDLPPEVEADRANHPPRSETDAFVWKVNPLSIYASWKYAEAFGGAGEILDDIIARAPLIDSLQAVPSDSVLLELPFVHNAYIAGYMGYLELEKIAGRPQTATYQVELDRLLALRSSGFSKDAPDSIFTTDMNAHVHYCRAFNVSRNFIYMVPELAEYLSINALAKVQAAVSEYEELAPYWFVSMSEQGFGESGIEDLNDYHALFQAKGWILKEPYEELTRYLDVPAVARGDLFYIQNLTTALEAATAGPTAEAPVIQPPGGSFDTPVTVTLASAQAGASIRYTLDGSTPLLSSLVYEGPFTLLHSTVVRAKAFIDGYNPSTTTTAQFTIIPTFADVPFDHWAHDYIEALYQAGYVVGCSTSPRLYCPERVLSRAESSVFILRGLYGSISDPPYPAPATPTFDDVPTTFWGFGWIESLWKDGFTAGCSASPRLYCPVREHTRAEGSVFFLRVKNGAEYSPPAAQGIFSDVPLTEWSAPWVEAAYNEGLLPACSTSPLSYCPDQPLDRAWAAYMMVMAKGGIGAFSGGMTGAPTPTPTPTPTPSPAPSATPSEAPSSTPSPSPTDTATPELLPLPTETPVSDATQTATPIALLTDASAVRAFHARSESERYWS